MPTVLVTNVMQYAGPGVVPVLLRHGASVICHDASFAEVSARERYEATFPGAVCVAANRPEDVFAEVGRRAGTVDAIVSNDVHPITPSVVEDVAIDDLRSTFEAVLVFPFRLAQLFVPSMKARKAGSFVFVTSARELRPEPGFAVPTTIRAATTAFAKALAKEVAPFGIQVNAVAPNYLSSELYYPRARFIEDPAGRDEIARIVPAGRLGEPDEVGELIAFLVSGTSTFTTGQVVYFTGAWP